MPARFSLANLGLSGSGSGVQCCGTAVLVRGAGESNFHCALSISGNGMAQCIHHVGECNGTVPSSCGGMEWHRAFIMWGNTVEPCLHHLGVCHGTETSAMRNSMVMKCWAVGRCAKAAVQQRSPGAGGYTEGCARGGWSAMASQPVLHLGVRLCLRDPSVKLMTPCALASFLQPYHKPHVATARPWRAMPLRGAYGWRPGPLPVC